MKYLESLVLELRTRIESVFVLGSACTHLNDNLAVLKQQLTK